MRNHLEFHLPMSLFIREGGGETDNEQRENPIEESDEQKLNSSGVNRIDSLTVSQRNRSTDRSK